MFPSTKAKTEVVGLGPSTSLHNIRPNTLYIAMQKLELYALVFANEGYRKLGTH